MPPESRRDSIILRSFTTNIHDTICAENIRSNRFPQRIRVTFFQ